MKVSLFDFQSDAVDRLKYKLQNATSICDSNNPQVISFSSPTGSGKTVMMTALFEKVFYGDEVIKPNKDATILWISDMPELNEQTRIKIETMSSEIKSSRIVVIDSHFDQEVFDKNHIYFLNTQKLGVDKLLTKKGGDGRRNTIWETINNSAHKSPRDFVLVIDEAHRGMNNSEKNHKTIMQKFLLGSKEDNFDKIPLVIGVSATPKRFEDLLAGTDHTIHKEYIDPGEVRLSGLLKDRILIHYPTNQNNAQYTLLTEAINQWKKISNVWEKFVLEENKNREDILEHVNPILVVQVEDGDKNKISKTDLKVCIESIRSSLGRNLEVGEVVHNFNDVGEILIDDYPIKYIEASKIQYDSEIKIVFFKMSLSTGWDCPRAEIMMSFRRAEDITYITQLLGRMIRTPLSRRIKKQAELNNVHLYLPNYDKQSVEKVIESLKNNEDMPPSNIELSDKIQTLYRNESLSEIFSSITTLVKYDVDKLRNQSRIKTLLTLGWKLSNDSIYESCYNEIKEKILSYIIKRIDEINEKDVFGNLVKEIMNVKINTISFDNTVYEITSEEISGVFSSSNEDLEKHFKVSNILTGNNGLNIDYWKREKESKPNLLDNEIKAKYIAFTKIPNEMDSTDKYCSDIFDNYFDEFRREIYKQNESSVVSYNKLRTSYSEPKDITWNLPSSIDFPKGQGKEYPKHLYVTEDNIFEVNLGTWEREILELELENDDVVAWLRNIDRKEWALSIPYESINGTFKSMYPDLIIIRKVNNEYFVDILEPHGSDFKDNLEKAKGLAKFAEKHGGIYERIQLIRKKRSSDGNYNYYRLDLSKEAVRRRIINVSSHDELDIAFNDMAVISEFHIKIR